MSVVTELTNPFPLDLQDLSSTTNRWKTLLPLVRPSLRSVETGKNETLLLDTAASVSDSRKPCVIVVVDPRTSSPFKLLESDKRIAGILISQGGPVAANDLPSLISDAGYDISSGIVLLRSDETNSRPCLAPDSTKNILQFSTTSQIQQDHLLRLLSSSNAISSDLLKAFAAHVRETNNLFHNSKSSSDKFSVLNLEDERIREFASAKGAIRRDLQRLMRKRDSVQEDDEEMNADGDVVYSVHFADVNGLSRLESYIAAGEIAEFFGSQGLQYFLSHSMVVNHASPVRGYSISVCQIPSSLLEPSAKPQQHEPVVENGDTTSSSSGELASASHKSQIKLDDARIRETIQTGCKAVIEAEPTITEYDTIVGDGDCGYTLRDGARKVLDLIKDKDLSRLPETVEDLVRELEVNMGGTSGALYCIYLTALANALATEENVPAALKAALVQLCRYTNARVGDRTMMDALIPFVNTLADSGGNAEVALKEARKGVEGTKKMEAKLGRSTYLDESAIRGVPDPGAYGLLVLFEGMVSAH